MSCWERLGIEPTDDQNAIRTAYRSRLPEVHPERDPEGFQALRSAYEQALGQARGETVPAAAQSTPARAGEQAEQQFVDLLDDGARRFQPQAWRDYCHVLDQLPLDVLDSIDGSLRHLLLSNGPLSHVCVTILAERMGWANRLMQLPFEEAEALDQLLQRIAEPDPFDLALLSDLPKVAQVETLWYVRTLNHLFNHRPLQEMRGWCSLHLCLPMPSDPAYYPGLYRQCTLAGIALGDALAHYQTSLEQTPDDLDTLYMLALQMQNHGQDAVDIWCRLWRERQLPEASAWLLAWTAHYSPERLPLLILAFNRSQSELGLQQLLEAPELVHGEPALSPQTLARWQRAASSELPPMARAFVTWQLGDSEWPLLAELLSDNNEPLHRLYRQAWLLYRGDDADLDALLALPSGHDPLNAVLLEGLQHQALQQRRWLREGPAWQALQQALTQPDGQLPPALTDDTVACSQMLRGFRHLRHYDDTRLQRLRRLLAPFQSWRRPACLELQLALEQAGRSLPPPPAEADARWRWHAQTLLLLGLLEQPQEWLARLDTRLATLPTEPGHPAHEIKAQLLATSARHWLLDLDEEDALLGLIGSRQVSPDILLNATRLPSATRIEACVQQHGHELADDPFGQMVLDALLYHDTTLTPAQRDEALQRLLGFTCPGTWFEPFRQGLIKANPQSLAQSVCKDNNLDFAIMQALFSGLHELYGSKRAQLPTTGVLRKLQKAKDSPATPIAIRLAVTLLLARYEQLLAQQPEPEHNSQWRIWQLGGRVNRLNFALQTIAIAGVTLPLSFLADKLSTNLALAVLGIAVLVLIGNLLRRLHDMSRGIGTLLMLLVGSFLLPYLLLLLFLWPGDRLPNRYGPPSGKRPSAELGLQTQLRRLNGVKEAPRTSET